MPEPDVTNVLELLGEQIRRARKRTGLTGAQLGERLGVSQSTIAGYETGRQQMTIVTLVSLASALGVPVGSLVDDLVTDEDVHSVEPSEFTKDMGERIAQRRDELGLTKEQLAARVRCSSSLISAWESGYREARGRMFGRLVAALETSASWLLGDVDWVAELHIPDEWPPGLLAYMGSHAFGGAGVRPGHVGLLAAMADHPRWRPVTTDDDWRRAAIALSVELGTVEWEIYPEEIERIEKAGRGLAPATSDDPA